MGYCTTYELTWKVIDATKLRRQCDHTISKGQKFCAECGKANSAINPDEAIAGFISANENMRYAISEQGTPNDSCKWYEHEKDMLKLSEDMRGILFTLHGVGEESGDIWNRYFLDGRCELAKAVVAIAPVSESFLKGK